MCLHSQRLHASLAVCWVQKKQQCSGCFAFGPEKQVRSMAAALVYSSYVYVLAQLHIACLVCQEQQSFGCSASRPVQVVHQACKSRSIEHLHTCHCIHSHARDECIRDSYESAASPHQMCMPLQRYCSALFLLHTAISGCAQHHEQKAGFDHDCKPWQSLLKHSLQ